MKKSKKILPWLLSVTFIASAASAVMPQAVFAESVSSSEQQVSGKLLFPQDAVNFSSEGGSIRYNGYENASKDIQVTSNMLIVDKYSSVFTDPTNTLPDGTAFYCWRIVNDTIDETSGKRTAIEVEPIFISYDSAKASLSITYGVDSTQIILTEKDGYTLNSLGEGFVFNRDTNTITGEALSLDTITGTNVIHLNDTYTAQTPVLVIRDPVTQNIITEKSVCPSENYTFLSFTATVQDAVPVDVEWSIKDGIDNVSVDNGTITVSPYFTGGSFTAIASSTYGSASVDVTVEHKYGEWQLTTPPTETTKGEETRICSVCGAEDKREPDLSADKTPPSGTVTIDEAVWSDFMETPDFSHYFKSSKAVIAASDDSGIKETAYYISQEAMTKEQLSALTSWTVGNEVQLSADGKAIIYVKITDNAGNVSYISSNGIVIDNTAPVISGIENEKTYYGVQTFSVADANLDKVVINNTEAQPENGIYTLSPENITSYTVSVTDKAGNETSYWGNIYPEKVTTSNAIIGITDGATYRKGSTITFTAKGQGMDNTAPNEGDIRYIPVNYTEDITRQFSSSSYTQIISTSKMPLGSHTLSVLFRQQVYSAEGTWNDTDVTDTKSVTFKIEKREEIEKARASIRASFFTVTFESNGGTKINYVLVDRSKTVSEPVDPVRTGYTFEGWYTDKNCTDKYDFSERVTSNLTLYAKWEKSDEDDNPFSDVSKDDWYYDNIAYVYATGLMNGTGDAEFSPDMPTTRAMIVTILYRLEGEPLTNGSTFSDVVSGSYYAKAVSWAKENDIVNGTSLTTFSPNKDISREQLMTILYRYAEFKDYDRSDMTALNGYSDADQISPYAADAFRWAVATNVASGRSDSSLAPKSPATRAEVAAAFTNFIENNEE